MFRLKKIKEIRYCGKRLRTLAVTLYHKVVAVKEIILEKLKTIEQQFDVRILYACESGSRTLRFASPDSDFDARFVYVHKADYYLSIDDLRDVIEVPE